MVEKANKMYKSKCYCTNLRQSAAVLSDFYDEAIEQAGLTSSQYRTLINLFRLKEANIKEWAETMGLEHSTMVRNIKSLEENQWIEEVPSQGRSRRFKLTSKGLKTVKKAEAIWHDTQDEMLEELGEDDAKAILRIGEKLQSFKLKRKESQR